WMIGPSTARIGRGVPGSGAAPALWLTGQKNPIAARAGPIMPSHAVQHELEGNFMPVPQGTGALIFFLRLRWCRCFTKSGRTVSFLTNYRRCPGFANSLM